MLGYQEFLKILDGLRADVESVNLFDLVADVQRRLPVNHSSVHDARDDATSVIGNFQSDALLHRKNGTINMKQVTNGLCWQTIRQ